MAVDPLVWIVSLGLAGALLVVDVAIVGRRPHVPSTAECVRYLVFYVGLALLFGIGVWATAGAELAAPVLRGLGDGVARCRWITSSCSCRITGKFAVPRAYQQTALLIGIMLALVLRGLFIWAGAAAIDAFSWVFYLFGAFLVWTSLGDRP